MKTTEEIIDQIDTDLAWRGPGGRALGHIVLPRDEAEYLRNAVVGLLIDNEELREKLHAATKPD